MQAAGNAGASDVQVPSTKKIPLKRVLSSLPTSTQTPNRGGQKRKVTKTPVFNNMLSKYHADHGQPRAAPRVSDVENVSPIKRMVTSLASAADCMLRSVEEPKSAYQHTVLFLIERSKQTYTLLSAQSNRRLSQVHQMDITVFFFM